MTMINNSVNDHEDEKVEEEDQTVDKKECSISNSEIRKKEGDLLIEYRSIFNEDHELEEAISFSYKVNESTIKAFQLSTLLFPDNLAPLFSGCEWAGTRLWKASILGAEYLHRNYLAELQNGGTVLELGCGLGIPGMVARCLGGKCIVTDQPNLLSQLDHNIQCNFTEEEIDERLIQAKALSWSKANTEALLSDLKYDKTGFDIVLNCDCVYEPLYGKSYILLVDVIDKLLTVNPKCIVLTSVERRYSDAIDTFLSLMEQLSSVSKVEKVYFDDTYRIQIYRTFGID